MDCGLNTVCRDWLKEWRNQAELSSSQIDEALGFVAGTTLRYETIGLARVPGCEMIRFILLYHIPPEEALDALMIESKRIRSQRLK